MTDSPLPVKTRVRLEIALAESQKLITGLAEVRWVKSLFDDDVFEMGLEFVELDPQSRIHSAGTRLPPGSISLKISCPDREWSFYFSNIIS